MEIRKHAEKRVAKRLGVPKTAVAKLVDEATKNGLWRNSVKGSLRRYIDFLIKKEGSKATDAFVYHGYVFLTAYDHIVTAWLLPEKYKNRKAAK